MPPNPPPDEAILRVAAGFRVPVAPAVLEAAAGGAAAPHLASGALLRDPTGKVRANPLFVTATAPVDPGAMLRALEAHLATAPRIDDADALECARLARSAGDPAAAEAWLARLARGALLGGTATAVATEMVASGLVQSLLPLARDAVLLLLVEGGRAAEVEVLLGPADDWLRARARLREGHPADAIALLAGDDAGDPRRAVVLGRAWLYSGQPERARAVLEAPAAEPAVEVERLALVALALLEHGLTEAAEAARDALVHLAARDREPRYLLHVHLGRADQGLRVGHLRAAAVALDDLRTVLAESPSPRFQASMEFVDALVGWYRGNHERLVAELRRVDDLGAGAQATVWQHARALVAVARSDLDAGRALLLALLEANDHGVLTILAHLDLLQGDPDGAAAWLDRASSGSALYVEEIALLHRRVARQRGDEVSPAPEAVISAYVAVGHQLLDAELTMDAGDLAAAAAACARARQLVDAHDIGAQRVEVWMVEADLAARAGDRREALRRLDHAALVMGHPDAPQSRLIDAARHALGGTLVPDAVLLRWTALRDHAAVALALRGRAGPPDARALLEGLPAALRDAGRRAFPAEDPADALLVTRDGASFRAPGGNWVDLRRRRASARLLDALAARRLAAPGRGLSVEDLLAAGWPGERVLPAAGANRVHVALAHLRSAGLADLLRHGADGHALDPAVPLLRVEPVSL